MSANGDDLQAKADALLPAVLSRTFEGELR